MNNLLPGYVITGSSGFFTGEFEYNIYWEIFDMGTNAAPLLGRPRLLR